MLIYYDLVPTNMETTTHQSKAAEAGATRQANRSPKGVYKGTREEWLEDAMHIMANWINDGLNELVQYGNREMSFLRRLLTKYGGKPTDYKFNPKRVKVSVSLQDGGLMKTGTMAHVHYAHATGNNYHEIRMSVELGGRKLKADSMRVADILLHEMIHTCAVFHGHRGAFRDIALMVGLTGKMTSPVATDRLNDQIKTQIVDVLGKYPHAKVTLIPRGQRGKGSRLIKCICTACDFNLRTSRKWIDKAAFELLCPMGCGTMTVIGYAPPKGEEEE